MSVMFEPRPRGAPIALGYAGRIGAATALVLTAVLAGCATPRGPVTAPVSEQRPPAGQVPSVQTGYASWYGKRHHGRETASGEAYNMNALTAAHPSLPLGTRLRVTNLRNGRSVEVRVNDRGPVVDGRVLDLSYAAARDLGAVAPGVIPVRVIALPAQ